MNESCAQNRCLRGQVSLTTSSSRLSPSPSIRLVQEHGVKFAGISSGFRLQVEDLRRERLVFDDLHRKLEAQLTVQQAEEVSLIETMNSFFEQGCKVKG